MHIGYFHQHFSTAAGSAGTRSYEIARRLVVAGHTVTIVCGSYKQGATDLAGAFLKGRRDGMVDGIRVIEFDLAYNNADSFLKRSATFLKFAMRSMWLATTMPFDLVFTTTTPLTAGLPGIAAKWLRRRPFVFEVRDLWPELPRAMGVIRNPVVLKAMEALEWLSYHSADRLIGLSPGIVEGIVKRGIARDRVAMIPNGCDTALFQTNEPAWRPDGVSDSDFLAVFTGTHGRANGLDAVIDAAAALQRRGETRIRILLVGDGSEKKRLTRRVANEGLGDIVSFHAPVPKIKLARLLKSADVGLQILANVPAFYYGTSPNKFFDYVAAGLPVIVNYPGWLAEIIDKKECGIAVPPENPEALADAFVSMHQSREHGQEKFVSGVSDVARHFSRDKLALSWSEEITIAMGQRSSTKAGSHRANR